VEKSETAGVVLTIPHIWCKLANMGDCFSAQVVKAKLSACGCRTAGVGDRGARSFEISADALAAVGTLCV